MDSSQLTFLGYGLLIGVLLAFGVAVSAWRRRLELVREVTRLRQHLHDHMEVSHEGSRLLKQELERLRQENENLRVNLQVWKQKPDRRELHMLQVYDHAVRQVTANAPGFSAYWENALREAEQTIQQADRGLIAFARRLVLPRARKPRDPSDGDG